MVKLSTQETVLSEDMVQAVRERANKRDGIIYDSELEYDLKAAVDFLVDRGDLIEHGEGQAGLLHFYTFSPTAATGRTDKNVLPGGRLPRTAADAQVAEVEKTWSAAGENRSDEEMNDLRQALADRNAQVVDDPIELAKIHRENAKKEQEQNEKNLAAYFEALDNESNPQFAVSEHVRHATANLEAEIEEIKKSAENVDGRSVTQQAAEASAAVEKDVEGRPLGMVASYEEMDKADAEARKAAVEAEAQARVKALEAEVQRLKDSLNAPATADKPETDEQGRDLTAARAAKTLEENDAREREAAAERARRQTLADLESQQEALKAQQDALKATPEPVAEEKDEQGRLMVSPAEEEGLPKPDAEPLTDVHSAQPAEPKRRR